MYAVIWTKLDSVFEPVDEEREGLTAQFLGKQLVKLLVTSLSRVWTDRGALRRHNRLVK